MACRRFIVVVAAVLWVGCAMAATAQPVINPGGPPVTIGPGAVYQIQASGMGTGPIVPAPSVLPGVIDSKAPLFALAYFDPPVIPAGGSATYRLVVGCPVGAVQAPRTVPQLRGLTLQPGASEQQLVLVQGQVWRIWTFNFRATPDQPNPDLFLVPSFTMEVNGALVAVPGADLQVTTPDDPAARRPLQIVLEPPGRTVFVGESVPIHVRVTHPGPGMLQNLTGLQIAGDALLVFNDSMYARQSKRFHNDANVMKVTIETDVLVTPLREGSFSVRATAQASIDPKEGVPEILAAYRPLIEAEPVSLNAVKVPTNGVLPGYSGAIGQIEIEGVELSTNHVRVGEPLTLTVTFRGEANLQTVEAPSIPRAAGWQLMPAAPSLTQLVPNSVAVTRAFRYTLIPLSDQITNTPVIPFSYFQPLQSSYIDLSVPAQPLVVMPGPTNQVAAGAASNGWDGSDSFSESNEPRTLRPLTDSRGVAAKGLVPLQAMGWFRWMQLVPAMLIGGIWLWDRRRRYLAAHPEIRAYRRARRAYGRCFAAARAAALSGDVHGYATAVVQAMRELAAPRIGANADSLVASDIIRLLSPENGNGNSSQRIRALFAMMDAKRFSRTSVASADLLADRVATEILLGSLLGQLRSWMRHRVYDRVASSDRSPAKEPSASVAGSAATFMSVIVFAAGITPALAAQSRDCFKEGISAYVAGNFDQAVTLFEECNAKAPSSGAFHNLGNAHWQRGEIGPAILAWERAVWLNPYQRNSRDNLVFARQSTRIDAPSTTWFEGCSAWLPVNIWAWTAAGSFWFAGALLILPTALGWRRAYWHHAGAALGLALFLLSVPALAGVQSRAQRGVVVADQTPVRLTPTQDGEVLTRLPAGTTARMVRQKDGLCYIRTVGGSSGWVDRAGFQLIARSLD